MDRVEWKFWAVEPERPGWVSVTLFSGAVSNYPHWASVFSSVNWFRSHRILWGFNEVIFADYYRVICKFISNTFFPQFTFLLQPSSSPIFCPYLEQTIEHQSNNLFIQGKNSLSPYLFKDLALSFSGKVSWSPGSHRLGLLSVICVNGYEEWFYYIFVYSRPLWISSRDICIICDSQWERLPNTKELGFSSLVTVLIGKQCSLLTHSLFYYSQGLHNICRLDFSFFESSLRHMALEESS